MVLVGPAAVMTVQNLKLSWLRGFASVRARFASDTRKSALGADKIEKER